jgi:hypothetical protein
MNPYDLPEHAQSPGWKKGEWEGFSPVSLTSAVFVWIWTPGCKKAYPYQGAVAWGRLLELKLDNPDQEYWYKELEETDLPEGV